MSPSSHRACPVVALMGVKKLFEGQRLIWFGADMLKKIAVDAMGDTPEVEVAGAVAALSVVGVVRSFWLVILPACSRNLPHDIGGLHIELYHASDVISMHDSPSAVRRKKILQSAWLFDLVKSGAAMAVVSAGNSGAIMAAGMLVCGRIDGV